MTEAIEKIGLKLESRKVPVDLIVVDRLEKMPTGNFLPAAAGRRSPWEQNPLAPRCPNYKGRNGETKCIKTEFI